MRLGRGFTRFRGRAGLLKGDRGAGNFVYKQNWGRRRVCVSALAEDAALLGRGRQGERAGYFLLSSSGSGRRKERGRAVGPGGRAASPCASPSHSPGGAHGPLPYSPVVCQTPDPTTTPRPHHHHRSPSSRGSQRDAAQRSPAQQTGRPGRSLIAASAHRKGTALMWKRATAAAAPGRAASASARRGARGPQGCAWAGGRAAGYSSGHRVCREIPVTRSRTWRRGTVILWPERTERGRYQGGRRPAGPQGGAGRGGETPPVMAGAGTGLGLPSLGTLVLPGPKGTYPPAKEEGSEVWRGFAAQRAGAVLRTEY